MSNIIHTHRTLFLWLALLVAVSVAGCGVDQSPLAADEEAVLQPAAKKGGKGKGPGDSTVNEKTMEENGIAAEMGSAGGKLTVQVQSGDELLIDQENLRIRFKVPKGALSRKESIEMTVEGSWIGLGDQSEPLAITFGPSGLVFKKVCTLTISAGPGLVKNVDIKKLQAWHEHDGILDQAGIRAFTVDETGLNMQVEVPGFSRYFIGRY